MMDNETNLEKTEKLRKAAMSVFFHHDPAFLRYILEVADWLDAQGLGD